MINITEAIKVSVPGVMEMELFPNGVNVSEVNESINKLNIDINQIYQNMKSAILKCFEKCQIFIYPQNRKWKD